MTAEGPRGSIPSSASRAPRGRLLPPAVGASLMLVTVLALVSPRPAYTVVSSRTTTGVDGRVLGVPSSPLSSPGLALAALPTSRQVAAPWRPQGGGAAESPAMLPGDGGLGSIGSALAWHDEKAANASMPTGALTATSCASATSCTAVGYATSQSGGEVPLAERLQAGRWAVGSVSLPPGSTDGQLTGVSCPSARFCLAVGYYYTDGGDIRVLGERFDGASWRRAAIPDPAGSPAGLFAVSCASATDCMAVGDYNDILGTPVALAERWDGYKWATEDLPPPSGAVASGLFAVSCPTGGWCTAAGSFMVADGSIRPLIESSAAGTWQLESAVVPPDAVWSGLQGVACEDTMACTAVGYVVSSEGTERALAETFDGTSWVLTAPVEPVNSMSGALAGVSCAASDHCVAVGQYSDARGTHGLAELWNGVAWARQSLSDPPQSTGSGLAGVSCLSADDCETVGGYAGLSTSIGLTAAYRWDGSKWTWGGPLNPAGAETTQLGGVACPSAERCVAVGFYQDGAGVTKPFSETSVGSRWRARRTGAPSPAITSQLTAVACASVKACFAIGTYSRRTEAATPLVEQLGGRDWQIKRPSSLPKTHYSNLSSISCGSPHSCTAVGEYSSSSGRMLPLVLHWNGRRFARQRPLLPRGARGAELAGVSCPAPSTCEAIGYYDTKTGSPLLAISWNGKRWRLQHPKATAGSLAARLSAVSCSSSRYCTAVGFEIDSSRQMVPLAERFRQGHWHVQTMPSDGAKQAELNSVSCAARRSCVAVGYEIRSGPTASLLESWNGSRWAVVRAEPPAGSTISFLNSVSCPAAGLCTAVGYRFGLLGIQSSLVIGRS